MPIMTARSTVTWDAATIYPVNSVTFDPERAESIPGIQFVGAPWSSGERPGGRWGTVAINADVPAALSATTHAHKTLLNACGVAYTGSGPIFKLGDPHFSSGDIYAGAVTATDLEVNVDGDGATAGSSWQTTVKSCVGGVTLTLMPGEMPTWDFNFIGQIDPNLSNVAATDQATIADIWAAASITSPGTTVRWTPGASATNTVFTAANLLEARISTNPRIAMRRGIGTSTTAGHGYFAPAITGYSPQIDGIVEVPAVSSSTNPKAKFLSDAVGNFGLQHTFSSGNTLTVLATSWKITALPEAVERDGILVQPFTLKPARAATVSTGLVFTWAYA